MGQLKDEPQSEADMRKNIAKWRQENAKLSGHHAKNDFQTAFIADLCMSSGYDSRITKGGDLLRRWLDDKKDDIMTFRDKSFTSIFTPNPSPARTPWFESFDDSITGFCTDWGKGEKHQL